MLINVNIKEQIQEITINRLDWKNELNNEDISNFILIIVLKICRLNV